MEQTTKNAVLSESWEEIAENPGSLEKELSKAKITSPSSPEKEKSTKQEASQKLVTILSGDEQRRTQYVPEVKVLIMKRPSQSASDAAAARPKVPLKTLEQRQAEYNEARIRILGNAEPVISDKATSSASNSVDVSKNCSPVAQGAQRGLITGAAARQQQQAKLQQQLQQRHNKQNKAVSNVQNKRGNNNNTVNNNLVNHSNGSLFVDQSRLVQQPQQPSAQIVQAPQVGNVPVSAYNARVPQFYPSEGPAVLHPYPQPPAFVPAHRYPPPMSSCQQFPTAMPAQQLSSPVSQQFTMTSQEYSLSVSAHQQYSTGTVTMSPYGAALPPQTYLPHTVAGATSGAVYPPYPQHPYQCFPQPPYPLPGHTPMISLPHLSQLSLPMLPTSFASQEQLNLSSVLPTSTEAEQLPAVQQTRQANKKQNKQRNKKSDPSLALDNSTSPTPAESKGEQRSSNVETKVSTITANGVDAASPTDNPSKPSSPQEVSPEEILDPTPMEAVTKKKNKKKKKKAQAKTSTTTPIVTTGKSNGTLSSKEGNGRIIRMPRGPDGTRGFNCVR